MKFSCEASTLARVLKSLQNAINIGKGTLTVLNYALVETREDALFWQATDMETFVTADMPAKIAKGGGGSVCLHLGEILSLVSLLGTENITLSVNDSKAVVLSKRGQYNIAAISENEFPVTPECKGDAITLPLPLLREAVNKCAFATSKEEKVRAALCNILIEIEGGNLTFVGTDTHRMSVFQMPFEGNEALSTLLKASMAEKVVRAATGEMVTLAADSNLLELRFENHCVTSGIIGGQFPNYNKVVPQWDELQNRYLVDAGQVQSAFERVALRVGNTGTIFNIEGDILTLETQSDSGTSREEVPLESATGNAQFKVESEYFRQFLRSVAGQKIELRRNDTQFSINCFRIQGDDSYTHLIMPKQI